MSIITKVPGSAFLKMARGGHFKRLPSLLFNDTSWQRVPVSDCACNKTVLLFVCFVLT